MKTKTKRTLSLAAALLAGLLTPGTWAAPIIMSPSPMFEFGELDNEQKVSHDFIVKNAGDEVLTINDVKTTCGCTVAKPEVNSLKPGEETKIGVTFNLKGKQGPQNKKITVLTNDPETPQFYLELKGTALSLIMMEPNILNLGRISDNDPHTQALTLKSMKDGHTFEIKDVTVDGAAPVTTSLETITPGKEYRITATTNANLMPGTISGRITITTTDPERPTMLANVYGHVIGALTIQPDRVRIQSRTEPDAKPATQYLQVLPGRVKEFQLLEVISPIEGMKAELIQRKDNDYHIKLSDMPVDNSLNGKELVVRTNLPESPEIRIPFDVRPARTVQAGKNPARVPVPSGAAKPPAFPARPTADATVRPVRPTAAPAPEPTPEPN